MNNFERLLSCIKHEHVYIQMHNFPDPDAVATAYGLQYLLRLNNVESIIVYKGRIDNTTTSTMIKLLNIQIVEIKEINKYNDKFEKDAEIIVVDSQLGNANTSVIPGENVMCIDHHPVYGNESYIFTDIRENVGACSSIIAQYYFENKVDIPKNVATALMYGIKIDTANMTRGVSKTDLDMFYNLYMLTDKKTLNHLDNSSLNRDALKVYANAIEKIKIHDRICYTSTGVDCPEALIANISDFVLLIENVGFTIVFSKKSDGIKLSVRSSELDWNAGKLTNQVLKEIGSGGGHEQMAGGFIPYDYKNQTIKNGMHISADEVCEMVVKRFIEKIDKLR